MEGATVVCEYGEADRVVVAMNDLFLSPDLFAGRVTFHKIDIRRFEYFAARLTQRSALDTVSLLIGLQYATNLVSLGELRDWFTIRRKTLLGHLTFQSVAADRVACHVECRYICVAGAKGSA